jgi:transcriptional regulator of heat shock response
VVPKTEEQLAAANRKKNLTAGQTKVRKTITTITKIVDELTAAALSAAAELSPMDQAMIHNLKNLLTELQQSDNDYLQCALDVGTTLPELANLWIRQLADCKSATVRIKALVPRVPAASVPTAAATGVEVAPVAADATPGV